LDTVLDLFNFFKKVAVGGKAKVLAGMVAGIINEFD